MSLLLFCGFSAINVINYYVSKNSLRQGILNGTLPLISDNIYSEIQRDLISPTEVSSLMANDTFLKDWVIDGENDLSKITNYLLTIKEKYDYVSTFFVSDRTNTYYHFKGILKQISQDDEHDIWYYRFKKLDVDCDLDVDTDEAAKGRLTIFINHRLTDLRGNFMGVTGVGVSLSQIGTLLEQYRDHYGTSVFMVDSKGLIQVHPDLTIIENRNLFDMPGLADKREVLLGQDKPYATTEYDQAGRHFIISARYIPEFDWYLIVEQVEDAILADIRANFIRNMAVGVSVTIVIIIVNVLLVNFFQGKLENMTNELIDKNQRLEAALGEVKQLSGLLPICANCKNIRDDKGCWKHIENYIQEHSEAEFTHSICPDCAEGLYPDLDAQDD